jgi:hypothetical protein
MFYLRFRLHVLILRALFDLLLYLCLYFIIFTLYYKFQTLTLFNIHDTNLDLNHDSIQSSVGTTTRVLHISFANTLDLISIIDFYE